MAYYRRFTTPGATFFFTLVSYQRQKIFCDALFRDALRNAINEVRKTRPFVIHAWVLLPDHLHCIWTLPPGDANFSQRWALIKRKVSTKCRTHYKREDWVTPSKRKHRESIIWQRRFWEHQIRDDNDFQRHIDYIHWPLLCIMHLRHSRIHAQRNPIKHGHVSTVSEWPYSTFHRYVENGLYSKDWGGIQSDVDAREFGE